MGAMLMKMVVFLQVKRVLQKSLTKNQDGSDVDENGCFTNENAFCVGVLGVV